MSFRLSYTPGQRINPRDYDGGETMRRGIGEALDDYLRRKQEDREWENNVALHEGELSPEESGMDKVRRIGGAIRRHLPGFDPRPGAEANLKAHGDPQVYATSDRSPRAYGGGNAAAGHIEDVNVNRDQDRSLDTLGTARDGVTRAPLANEMKRVVIRGPHGQEAIVPSLRAEELRKQADEDRTWEYREGVQHKNRLEEYQARPYGNSLSPAEWDRRQGVKYGLDRDLAAYRAKLREAHPSDPHWEEKLDMMRENLRLRYESLGISIDEALARTPDPNPFTSAANEDNPQAAVAAGERGAARKRLKDARGRVAPKTFSADPNIKRAQELWDSNPDIQRVRPRPQ